MSGILVAVAGGGTQNAIYGAGLYSITLSAVDQSPITIGTLSSQSGALNATYQWIGYYRPASSSAIQLGASCSYTEWIDPYSSSPYQANWGGGGNSTCYIWTGNTAISGYNTSNYTALIQNGTSGTNFTAPINTYVPIRIQWSTSLPYYNDGGFFDSIYYAQSSFGFTIGGTQSISGRIFYNTLTNGF